MKLSRNTLTWTAPTTTVEGQPITYPLDYELGVGSSEEDLVPTVAIVGTLQPNGRYEAPLSDMSWEFGSFVLALRAINRDEPEYFSVWSNTVTQVVTDPTPAAPVLFV